MRRLLGGLAIGLILVLILALSAVLQLYRLSTHGTGAAALAATGTPAPMAQRTPPPDQTPAPILIWWPAPIYPGEDSPALPILNEQIRRYETGRSQSIAIRVKRAEGAGGILQTLYSGSSVAASVMPDLALLRRADLIQAASGKLIQPIDVRGLSADDLFPSGLALGQVQGIQYGIPYVMETQHAVQRSTTSTLPPRTLDELLQSGQAYLFPGADARGVNPTLLNQYIGAGGRIADEKGAPALDREPLRQVLGYYEQAVDAKNAGPGLLDYTSPSQYWPLFLAGKVTLVQIDSTTFLAQRGVEPPGAVSAGKIETIPVPGASRTVILDSWLWVLTAANPERRARGLDALAWLLEPGRQGEYTWALRVLPSRRSALNSGAWRQDAYADFASALLEKPLGPLPDSISPVVATALQEAFESVLAGRKSAEAAANDSIARVAKR